MFYMARLVFLHNMIHGLRRRRYQGAGCSHSNWPFRLSFREGLNRHTLQKEAGQIERSNFVIDYVIENVNQLT